MKKANMKHLTAFVCMCAVLLGLTGLLSLRSLAGQDAPAKGKTKEMKSTLMTTKSRDAGTTVKAEAETNTKGSPKPLSVAKGGKARGTSGTVHVDSHVGYYTRIYDNGYYVGTVAPSGDMYYAGGDGIHVIFGRVYFRDGSYFTVGPVSFSMDDGDTLIWHMYQ